MLLMFLFVYSCFCLCHSCFCIKSAEAHLIDRLIATKNGAKLLGRKNSQNSYN